MAQSIGLRGQLELKKFNRQVDSFIKQVNRLRQETTSLARTSRVELEGANESLNRFGLSWGRIKDIITGVTIIDIFRTIRRAISDVTSEALEATATFQDLTIQLQAVLARDYAREFGIPASDAFALVGDQAQELLGWIREVAVSTPFSVENLARALAYGQAFGFNVAQTKRLTLATGEFVAGMGLTDEHFSRIIYNFGQMLASGRVLGREMRDLANNMVPIKDVLQLIADQADVTLEQVRKWQKEGTLSAEQFISAFVQISETTFPGAMERMSKTINGVSQNITDFIHTLIGLELLGPVMRELAAELAGLLDAVFSVETVKTFAILGESLLQGYLSIRDAVKEVLDVTSEFFSVLGIGTPTAYGLATALLYISESIRKLILGFAAGLTAVTKFAVKLTSSMGMTFVGLAQQAVQWGYNIIVSLAEGMAAALSYVIAVITAIANVIASMLSAHSPPAILPDLPKWGQAAMESWLEGWTKADFSIFNNLANLVERFLRSIPGGIGKNNKGLINAILGSRKVIAQAVAGVQSGMMSIAQAANLVGQSTRSLSEDFKTYATALFKVEIAQKQVEQATKAVEAAQKNLNDITDKYSAILADLNKQLTEVTTEFDEQQRLLEIQEALESGLLTAQEKAKLEAEKKSILLKQQIRDVEDQRDAEISVAEAQIEAAREAQTAAQAQLKAAQEQLAIAQQTIELQVKNNELLQEQLKLLEALAKKKAGAGGKGLLDEGIEIPGLEFEGIFEKFESELAASRKEIAAEISRLRDEIRSKIDQFVTSITKPFEQLKSDFADLLTGISDVFSSASKNAQIRALALMLTQFGLDVQTALGNLKKFWDENGNAILEAFNRLFTGISEALSPLAGGLFIGILKGLGNLGDTLVDLSEQLVENGPQITDSLNELVTWILETGLPGLDDFSTKLRTDTIPAILSFGKAIVIALPFILPLVGALRLLGLVAQLFLWVGQPLAIFISLLPDFGALVASILEPLTSFSGILSILSSTFLWVVAGIGSIIVAFASVPGLFEGVKTIIVETFKAIGKVIGPQIEKTKDAFKKLEPAFKAFKKALAFLMPIIKTIAILIGVTLIGAIVGGFLVLSGIVTGILNGIATAIQWGLSAFSVYLDMAKLTFEGLKEFFSGIWAIIVGIFTLNLEAIKEGFIQAFTGAIAVVTGLFFGIGAFISAQLAFIVGLIAGFVAGVYDFFKELYDSLVGNSLIPDLFAEMIKLFTEKPAEILESIKTWISDILSAINLADFWQAGVDLFERFKSGIKEKFDATTGVIATVKDKITETKNKILTLFPVYLAAGKALFQQLLDGIEDKFTAPETGVFAIVSAKIQEIIDNIADFWEDFKTQGKAIIEGIIAGLQAAASSLYDTIRAIIAQAISEAEEASGFGSPAKKFMPLGASWVRGMEMGARSQFKKTKRVFQQMVGELTSYSPNSNFSSAISDQLRARGGSGASFAGIPVAMSTINRTVNVSVDAHYQQTQSEASIYYDISAALAHSLR